MARDGSEVLAMARELHPKLILLDVVLPKVDGRGVAIELTQEMGANRPAIILLSASSKLSELADELGVEGYITKPFERTTSSSPAAGSSAFEPLVGLDGGTTAIAART